MRAGASPDQYTPTRAKKAHNEKDGESTKLFWTFVGPLSLIGGLALLHDGASIYQVVLVLVVGIVFTGAFFLLAKRLDSSRPIDSTEQSTEKKSNALATVFGLLAAGTLVVSLQQWISPSQPGNRNLGIEGVILAVFFGYLSFRAYRQLKNTDAEQPSRGNPKTILIGISIFTALFIAGNVRRILSARSNDLWIGIGQMVIWLPIFTYHGYREYRRMKNQ